MGLEPTTIGFGDQYTTNRATLLKIKGNKIKGNKIKGNKIKGYKIKGNKIKGNKIKGNKIKEYKIKGNNSLSIFLSKREGGIFE